MAVIKQISVFDGTNWGTDDIGANAGNIDFVSSTGTTANIAGSNNLYTGLNNILPASKLTASRALVTGSDQKLAASNVTATQLGYLSGASSSIQTQINTLNTNLAKKVGCGVNTISSNVSADGDHKQGVRLYCQSSYGKYMFATDANGIFLWDSTNSRTVWRIALNDLITTRSVESSAYLKTGGTSASTTVPAGTGCCASMTAPTVTGYVFVAWIGSSSNGFVAPGYFENARTATTNLWVVPTTNISNKKIWGYALYRRNVDVTL